ncbi:Nuclear transport factor 2 (NTF2) domain [Geosmithia morbida]|uniref:Nuclear transport factor 2 (NTF2) domain n=1 Tax=Geosmithia morbida TaxID=1094350 RepID=A0A9P4YSB8_9HYPO|nr:Nuclear transport factor 2 (NTF2) domain [Geosmithia morbida]KAF4121165.1 Nuclear transport factor 2 (NTF2) domain [Geosmithia morbida]
MATNGNFAHQDQYKAPADQYTAAPASIDPASSSGASNDLSKDEVGWYFVEQYYTTLSKSPEKLHLFYGKRSQFVSGIEAEVTNVSVGRQAIQERIKKLDFQDCKVRISNVDSQASFEGIVIQVIGEISSKTGEPKKFVQTFVLAQQPSGYFVLNDILRYIDEDGDENAEEAAGEAVADKAEDAPAPAAAETEAAADAPKEESADLKADAVDEKLEEVAHEGQVNGDAAAPTAAPAADEPAREADAPADADSVAVAEQVAEETTKEAEEPKEPTHTPAVKAEPQLVEEAPAAPEPAAPSRPMTWASRAAAAAGPRPVVPLPKTATPPAQAQASRAPPQAAAQAAAPAAPAAEAAPTAAAAAATTEAPAKEASGWQTAGSEAKRQNRPQSISAAPEKEGTLGYVKYVTDKVQEADLKKALEAHGELAYFDINRDKNCAFVEYKTTEGYQGALNSNPHIVNGEQIIVEQRRPKTNAYGGNSYGRGGGAQRGRGGFNGNRGGGQGPRGNFSGQGRGRGGAPRGRGGAQATNA